MLQVDNEKDIRTVSVFSGAGGLDIGAIKAGANVIWANDMMKEACQTYRVNIGNHIVCGNARRGRFGNWYGVARLAL